VGRILTVTNSNSFSAGRRKKTISREIVIGSNAIKFITITIVAILAIVYLNQSTAGANRSIKISDIEQSKTQLTLEKERLQAEQTRLKSLKEIDGGIEKQIMEPGSQVGHIQSQSDRTVAN